MNSIYLIKKSACTNRFKFHLVEASDIMTDVAVVT